MMYDHRDPDGRHPRSRRCKRIAVMELMQAEEFVHSNFQDNESDTYGVEIYGLAVSCALVCGVRGRP